ncbi:PIN domain-containing protein [Thermosipho ferrireducens]|uniref:PIN domain-containing protein n=1 Tax=Thermosipho ferrireducens TaxID=2571116 RepID=A0ABX7SA67_9BACT|nr:PIN domain-containing protein [Thermosipho ferrireducens]
MIFSRYNLEREFRVFIDVIKEFNIVEVGLDDLPKLFEISKHYNLDFDDSYQYYLAKSLELKIVSYDADFDKTTLGRIMPGKS